VVDIANIVLAVIAVFSALFVALTEGFKITLGFRGSEETRMRKERIDTKLHQELDLEIEDFLSSDACRGGNPDRIIGLQDLGFKAMMAEEATNDLIKGADKNMKMAIRNLLVGTLLLSITVIAFVNFDLTQSFNAIMFLFYVAMVAFIYWRFAVCTRKAFNFRERFITLDEKPTLEKAADLDLQ
jgi:hypothetical protein